MLLAKSICYQLGAASGARACRPESETAVPLIRGEFPPRDKKDPARAPGARWAKTAQEPIMMTLRPMPFAARRKSNA